MLHDIALSKQWTETWPYIVNAVFRLVQIRLNEITFVGFKGAISPISPPLDLPLHLSHIY